MGPGRTCKLTRTQLVAQTLKYSRSSMFMKQKLAEVLVKTFFGGLFKISGPGLSKRAQCQS